MRIPKKISPCPIVEAIVEIKFDYVDDLDPDAIFGIVYRELHGKYPKTEKLPVLQLPEAIRLKDPNLSAQPQYKLSNDNFLFQIGPKIISINNTSEYVGWDVFFKELMESFSLVKKLNIIKSVNRLGIRYINFFPKFNILDNVKLKINLNDDDFKNINSFLRAEVPSGKFLSVLQVGNNMTITQNKQQAQGSVIDIDTHIAGGIEGFFDNVADLLNEGHYEEKKVFYGLLTDDYLKSLNPEF